MIEIQVAQLASSCPNNNSGKLPGQPEVPPKENISTVTTRTGKSTQEPPYPKDARFDNSYHVGQVILGGSRHDIKNFMGSFL